MATQAETVARSISSPDLQAQALAEIAGALAAAGQYQQAQSVAHSITEPGGGAQALAVVAGALAGAGQHEQAAAWPHRLRPWPAPSPTRSSGPRRWRT